MPRLSRHRIFAPRCLLSAALWLFVFQLGAFAQERVAPPTLTAESLQGDKVIELDNFQWHYHAGDDAAWAKPEFDDGAWETLTGVRLKPDALPREGFNGRAWFRLRITVGTDLAGRNLALVGTQNGASEIYLDGEKIAQFGDLNAPRVVEYNPNRLPLPFRFNATGEHILAVRFASRTFADMSSGRAVWLTGGGAYPGITLTIRAADDLNAVIREYANNTSMRGGFFFIGVLIALALLHFLLFLFYRVERGNLYYSFYAGAFAVSIFCGNFLANGTQSVTTRAVLRIIASTALAIAFIALMAFLQVAFGRRFRRVFIAIACLWLVSVVTGAVLLGNLGIFSILANLAIFVSFSFSALLLANALRDKRPGAWIIMIGVQLFALGMFSFLLLQLKLLILPVDFYFFSELAVLLAVPVAVSIYLARNIARTNRDLTIQLAQVEQLSQRQIEQERQAAILRAENERRAKELEEARQLQLSMLPKRVPQIPNLEIAAYMKPATEVGGDYYDFHIGEDGTLTVAVGDATGHGLKAGSVVTATKSLFNAFAKQNDIPQILKEMSQALKQMNLRGLFMAMTILKVKDDLMTLSIAGMPAALVYRADTQAAEEISLRAVPLGSMTKINYQQREVALSAGDCVVLMSDGFPEMFNQSNEMLGFEKAAEILPKIANLSSQEIINHLVKVGEDWAGTRPQDDDVTFVVLKAITDASVDSPN